MAVYPFLARKVYEYYFLINTQPIDFWTIKFLAGIAGSQLLSERPDWRVAQHPFPKPGSISGGAARPRDGRTGLPGGSGAISGQELNAAFAINPYADRGIRGFGTICRYASACPEPGLRVARTQRIKSRAVKSLATRCGRVSPSLVRGSNHASPQAARTSANSAVLAVVGEFPIERVDYWAAGRMVYQVYVLHSGSAPCFDKRKFTSLVSSVDD